MGKVFRAYDRELKEDVALKLNRGKSCLLSIVQPNKSSIDHPYRGFVT